MQSRKFPDMAELSMKLAADNQRVSQYIDTLTARIDDLVAATLKKDWDEVRRLGEHIAQTSATYGCQPITESAERLCTSLDQPDNELEVRRNILKLVGSYGRADRRPWAGKSK